MKVAICYPPLESPKGTPCLAQDRQFQWFHTKFLPFPVVPASAATLLKNAGYQVAWLDGIASGWNYEKFLEELKKENPDLMVMETKTPVVKRHWKIISNLKNQISNLKIVLVGDHVTALPEESMQNSQVDYILTGGDYDFLLLNLCNHLTCGEKLEAGIWYRENPKSKGKNPKILNTGHFKLDHDLNKLPLIDRDLTQWKLYAYDNGNLKYLPGTYIMAGRDCWWGKCTFCAWTTLYPQFRVRTPENVLNEVEMLIEKYGVREIMDDTGTFPAGAWLEKFCQGMIERGYHKKVRISCNMRAKALNQEQYNLMGKAGFRLVLYGLESGNQETLDRINKGTQVEDIVTACKMAKKAGLSPHLTVMVGYPWETEEEAQKTLGLAKKLFVQGYADTLQATMVIPYPGTRLFEECQKNGWLETLDWDEYDMTKPVMKTPMSPEKVMAFSRSLYGLAFQPKFLLRHILSIRTWDDLVYLWRAARHLFGHLLDFSRKPQEKPC